MYPGPAPLAPVPRPMLLPVGLTTLAFAGLVGLASGSLVPAYYPILLALGALAWTRRATFAARLSRALSALPLGLAMVAAGYLAVIFEETLAGLLHAMTEGAGPLRMLQAAGQFIAFNLFAFTGIILSLAFWHRKLAFGRWDLFLAAGGWGLFSEGSLFALLANPVAGALLILPNMAVYAVILWPLTLICPPEAQGTVQRPLALRLVLIWLTAFALSLPPIVAVSWLRATHGDWFPACAYIAC
ncbi:hypothetical protein [Stagnihabitans tardus]|uniref:Uncharacterized protein n=1 Tax=Stagnihabitans tardus TaxID=2699202 RepID=A0AAE5BTA4_9RHOB|nr:hypothetical protein [Stagnihabitans tardus]NBZ85972.1 hypothetical protein [Stagnihabitans tardus]